MVRGELVDADLLVDGEKIVGLVSRDNTVEAAETLDATGKVVLPGIIDTALARANNWFDHDQDWRAAAGIDPPTPDKPAYPLVFLCSPAASHVNGATLIVDAGWIPSQMTGTFVGGFMAEMGD